MKKVPGKWNKQNILALLAKDNKAVERGILAIYNKQTEDEQASDATRWLNGVGFSGVDAEFGSSLAKNIQKWGKLTDKQLPWARKIIFKYAQQLANIANYNEMNK